MGPRRLMCSKKNRFAPLRDEGTNSLASPLRVSPHLATLCFDQRSVETHSRINTELTKTTFEIDHLHACPRSIADAAAGDPFADCRIVGASQYA
jgi:hypothetical protein